MLQKNDPEIGTDDIVELAQIDSWMLGTEKVNGIVSGQQLFMVSESLPLDRTSFVRGIERINRQKPLGRGYQLEAFLEPCCGCRVTVDSGWELVNTSMHTEFLSLFLQELKLGNLDD